MSEGGREPPCWIVLYGEGGAGGGWRVRAAVRVPVLSLLGECGGCGRSA